MADVPAAWAAPLTTRSLQALRLLVEHGDALTTNRTMAPRPDVPELWRVPWVDGRAAAALVRRRLTSIPDLEIEVVPAVPGRPIHRGARRWPSWRPGTRRSGRRVSSWIG